MRSLHPILLAILMAVACPRPALAVVDPGDEAALKAVTRAVCDRQVVMLGESATHGDGHTEAFKVALVERLIDRCGFDAVYFEASYYEFVNINRHLRMMRAVSDTDALAAVGGLWKFDKEFQPLVKFLLTRADAGRVTLGGIDDQLGQAGQDYANKIMIANLTMVLPKLEGEKCSAALHRRIYSEDWEGDEYSKADRAEITSCLSEVRKRYAADRSATNEITNNEWLGMIDAVQRWISRDSLVHSEQLVERDRSMFDDFEWLRRQEPKRHKVIVWAATVHIAKEGDSAWGYQTGLNFGSLVHGTYGAQAFSLGFSSLGGSYRQGSRETKEEPVPPANSLEAATANPLEDAVFVGPGKLALMGAIPGAIFRHSYETLQWSQYLDGVVVFRKQYPPTRTQEPRTRPSSP